MGFFDIFKPKAPDPLLDAVKSGEVDPFAEVAEIISGANADIAEKAALCVADPKKYYGEHYDRFCENGIKKFSDDEFEFMQWLCFLDVLESSGYVCERYISDGKDGLLYLIGNLTGAKANGLTINPDDFAEKASAKAWLEVLDAKWSECGMCLAAFDICRDCVVLFPCRIADMPRLQALAPFLGQHIEYARKMYR